MAAPLMSEVARDYVTDGIPSSGVHEIRKRDLRSWGAWVEQFMTAASAANGGLVAFNQEQLFTHLSPEPYTMAWVIDDPEPGYNGIYQRNGNDSPPWLRIADLPYGLVRASNIGAGTADAIQATTDLPLSGSALVLLNIYEANAGSPVTVQFNGAGTVYTVKTNTGNDIAPGGLVPGMQVVGYLSGTTLRLITDQVSTAVVAQAEDAAERAELAAATVNLPLLASGDAVKQLYVKPDESGYFVAPTDTNIFAFNPVGDGVADDEAAVLAAAADGRPIYLPPGRTFKAAALEPADLPNKMYGGGQVEDSLGKRAPWYARLSAAPSSFGDGTSANTAFDGDLSGVIMAAEHRIEGAATLGQPATGYSQLGETAGFYWHGVNTSGWNQNVDSNDGRTGAALLHINVINIGQGDYFPIHIKASVAGSKVGATSFIANPATGIINGDVTASSSGVYLNVLELNAIDQGHDVAAIGAVFNFKRDNDTAALQCAWMGIRPQSSGSKASDVLYSGAGKWRRGVDLTAVDWSLSPEKAGITLPTNVRIYFDSVASGELSWSKVAGGTSIFHSGTALIFAHNNIAQMSVSQDGIGFTPTAFFNGMMVPPKRTVAELNALAFKVGGMTAYATNGRRAGQSAGAGTGVLTWWDATGNAWIAADTGQALAA